ncbi:MULTISPECIES: c-type cytochrome [Legionella]|uniref:Cytochrome c4 n=1 Tax=Legionella septentrionalis TaxID=2498109 RepID=A0A433JHC5_9GAMM|nr:MULTISPECIES: c-type cytochrome [Legionella]MCP0914725.1 cytochrome c4 [Legionella sp. 27cVA30]RUQ81733.1 cytochrome c4 [Legionella septentrionalis]RUR02799.1 cytochrome c4 [Legionella septentrionalis]RUR11397.1 cytochrome c4 [Legionella septentrionalis]RUR15128.1 cytochrome c4 [Legionella septentrionalis]
MKKMVFILLLLCFSSYAAGNYQDGEAKAAACVACHGAKGISTNPQWPSLAGQHAGYLAKQLRDYKQASTRNSPIMAPIVAKLSDQDIEDLAVYYSKLPLPEGQTPQRFIARGEQLYRGGDFKSHITACIACHGPRGTGNAQAGFPVLSGQQAVYTMQQLQAFKDNQRSNDFNEIMRDISVRMSKEDMEAVAYYVAGLH